MTINIHKSEQIKLMKDYLVYITLNTATINITTQFPRLLPDHFQTPGTSAGFFPRKLQKK